MTIDLSRRSFFSGLGAAIAAPAIVRAASLMPVRAMPPGLVTAFDFLTVAMVKATMERMRASSIAMYADGEWSKAPGLIYDADGRLCFCFSDGRIVVR